MATENNGDRNSIWVAVGLTKNLQNYESLRLDAGKKHVLEDGEDEKEAFSRLWDEVRDQLEEQLGK